MFYIYQFLNNLNRKIYIDKATGNYTQKQLGIMFDIYDSTVSKIIRNRSYKQ